MTEQEQVKIIMEALGWEKNKHGTGWLYLPNGFVINIASDTEADAMTQSLDVLAGLWEKRGWEITLRTAFKIAQAWEDAATCDSVPLGGGGGATIGLAARAATAEALDKGKRE